jgi:hypothetical protein
MQQDTARRLYIRRKVDLWPSQGQDDQIAQFLDHIVQSTQVRKTDMRGR